MIPEEKWGFLTRGIERADPLILMQYISFFKDAILAIDKELTSLRAEVERLGLDLEIAIDERNGLSDYIFKMKPRIRQLEEAVEWACSYDGAMYYEDNHCIWGEFERELRRKAGMEE